LKSHDINATSSGKMQRVTHLVQFNRIA